MLHAWFVVFISVSGWDGALVRRKQHFPTSHYFPMWEALLGDCYWKTRSKTQLSPEDCSDYVFGFAYETRQKTKASNMYYKSQAARVMCCCFLVARNHSMYSGWPDKLTSKAAVRQIRPSGSIAKTKNCLDVFPGFLKSARRREINTKIGSMIYVFMLYNVRRFLCLC